MRNGDQSELLELPDPPQPVGRDWNVHGSFAGWVGNFATIFAGVFFGVFFAGLLLGLIGRAYLHWSAAEAVAKINQSINDK